MKKLFALLMAAVMLMCMVPAAMAAPSDFSTLEAGAAKRDITPSADMLPLSRAPHVTMTGVMEDDGISVRVIALHDTVSDETALIVCCETGRSFGPTYANAIVERFGIPLENIVMTSNHVHAAPEVTEVVADIEYNEGDSNQVKWQEFAMSQMLDAVAEAIDNLEPVSVGLGYSESYVNVNRNTEYATGRDLGWAPDGATDRTLGAMQLKNKDGDTVAFIIDYAVHGTVMHANTLGEDGTTLISSDLPGYTAKYLEAAYDGAIAVWLSGAAGDQNPIIQNDLYYPDPVTGEWTEYANNDYAILTWLSAIHYADVKRAIESIDEFKTDLRLKVAFSEDGIPLASGEGEWGITMQSLRIGDIVFACFPGELFSSTGLYIKEKSDLAYTFVVNHCWQREGQNNGYQADDWTIENGGFGQRQAKFAPGYLNDALVNMLNAQLEDEGVWVDNGDGTSNWYENGEKTDAVTINGLDGIAGTDDDNRIVNPAGKTLLENVQGKPAYSLGHDMDFQSSAELGNGFLLEAGADGLIGTTDDIITFGSYPTSASGKEAGIVWYPVAFEDGVLTMACRNVLDAVQFNLDLEDGNDWASSNYRNWLNSYEGGVNTTGDTVGFYNRAFNEDEQAKIVTSKVDMSSDGEFIAYNRRVRENWWYTYSTNTGNDTYDKVYAMSGEEAFEWFGRSKIATLEELGHAPELYTNAFQIATDYAYEICGVKINLGGNGPSYVGFADSWTRSAGENDPKCGVFLGSVGSLNSGREVTTAYGARPVIAVAIDPSVNAAGIKAAKVQADATAAETVEVPVTYTGSDALTSVRLTISCDVPVKEIISDNDFEFNPDTGAVVVYKNGGTDISNDLFTIVFDITGDLAGGTYPVTLTLIEATVGDELVDVDTIDGEIDLFVGYINGDVNRDGELDNCDLIMIARYLVELESFDDEQKELADYNDDGEINNIDLVLIARELVK